MFDNSAVKNINYCKNYWNSYSTGNYMTTYFGAHKKIAIKSP